MPTINDRLATLEAAVRQITGSGAVTTIVIDQAGDVIELEAMDDQQNARLAAAEAGVLTLSAELATANASIALLESDLAALEARVTVLEATSYGVEAPAGLAQGTGEAYAATAVPTTPNVYPDAGLAVGIGAAYNASVTTGGTEGASTTHALPYTLGT